MLGSDASAQQIALPGDDAKLPSMATVLNYHAPVNSAVRIRPGKRHSIRQVLDLQKQLYNAGMAKGIAPSALAQVSRAWCELEERKRIIRMKPKPKDVDVSKDHAKKPKDPRTRSFIEE